MEGLEFGGWDLCEVIGEECLSKKRKGEVGEGDM